MEIIKNYLPETEFKHDVFPKSQIYLHHTAGNSNPHNVVKDWASDKLGAIGTAYVIGGVGDHDGVIVEALPVEKWIHHLGVKAATFREMEIPYKNLDAVSVGIELCSWGILTYREGKYYTYVNRVIPEDQVCILQTPHKGSKFYHKYTPKQIEATRKLLVHLGTKFGIPLKYNDDIWGITERAFKGEKGVYTHNSVRADKSDVFPQPELIQMLKTL